MARILAISSYVASGHVGLGAIVPTLQAMGHEVVAVPTVVLSCHPGHAGFAGSPMAIGQFRSILDALAVTGRLDEVDGIITGYMPSPEHVEVVRSALAPLVVDRCVGYLCDPIIGDWPKGLYVREEIAHAVRDLLVPMADIATPNVFELSWLSGVAVTSADDVAAACEALGTRRPRNIVVTSVPIGADQIGNVLLGADECGCWRVPLRQGVPHGTGDLFAALLLGHLVEARKPLSDAVARATAGADHVISASLGRIELELVKTIAGAASAAPTAGTGP